MADKLVAVKIKQQDNTYSNEIPIGAKAENVAYDNTKNLLQVLGTIDMYKGNVQTQLDALLENFNGIAEDVAEAIDSWVTEHMPSWDPETHLDDTLTADNLAPVSSAVPKLIAVNEAEIQGTKMKISTTGQEDLTVLTPNDIDNTLSQQGEAADAKATGEIIVINGDSSNGTRINITTTEEDIEIPTMDDVNDLKESLDDSGLSWNLIPENYPSGDEYETQGITFVKNADGTVSSSGTATAQARYYWATNWEVEPGTYMLGGVPNDASSRSFGFQYAITDGPSTSSDYSLAQFGDIEITITEGKKLSIRSWYYTGYVDSGHTWAIYLGHNAGEYQSTKNPKYFIPVIYDNKEKVKAFESVQEPIQDLLAVTAKGLKGVFELGSLSGNGRPYEDQSTHQNRVMSSDFQTYPPKSILSISDGYRVAIHYYNTNSGASVERSGWISAGKYEFLDYPYVKMVIARDPETAEEADVDTFTGAISYVSSLATADILDVQARLTKLEEGADTPLPEYWQTYLKTKAADVKSAVYNVGSHGIAFQFFTDIHLPLSDYRYYGYTLLPYILAYIKKNCFVPDTIFGGDALTNNPTSAEALKVLESYQIAFSNIGVYNVFGNHDNNPYGGTPARSAVLTDDAVYSVLFRNIERKTDLESGGYWKLDYPNQKVRLIALNTHLAAADWLNDAIQVNWFINTLANTPAGYTVLVIPHLFFEAIIENGVATGVRISVAGERIKVFLDAFANRTSGQIKPNDDVTYSYDFTGSQAKLAGVIAGHAHNDAYLMADAGYPMIAVVCDAVNGSYQQVARTRKTYTEHAYDVVCLDVENQTINCIRIGSGEDRSFSYS